MSNTLTPIITTQGRKALLTGFASSDNFRFAHLELGDAGGEGYQVNPSIQKLRNKRQRVVIDNVVFKDSNRLYISAVAGLPKEGDSSEAFDVHEIGFFLQPIGSNGKDTGKPILFAIYATKPGGEEKALLTKEPGTEFLMAFDLLLPDLGQGDLQIDEKSYLHLGSASHSIPGAVQLASEAEVIAGENDHLAVTPLGVNSAFKTAFNKHLANNEQTRKGDDSSIAVTPAGLKDTMVSQLATSDEVLAGETGDKAVTPKALQAKLEEVKKKRLAENLQDPTVNGTLNFGTTTRQMLDLYGSAYAIGVQHKTQYFRSDNHFAWFTKGKDSIEEIDPGDGGKVRMVLKDGKLGVGTDDPKSPLHIKTNTRYHGILISHGDNEDYAAKLASDNGHGYVNMCNDQGNSRASLYGKTGLLWLGDEEGNAVIEARGNENEIYFKDNGQIRSRDNHHRILFRRTENKLELREWGDIVFSSGSTGGGETSQVVIDKDGWVIVKQGIRQEAWKEPKLLNHWTNYSTTHNPCGFYKDTQGVVHLRGLVQNSGGRLKQNIFNLPKNYRPEHRFIFPALSDNQRMIRLDIKKDGNFIIYGSPINWISLDNISFRAAGA